MQKHLIFIGLSTILLTGCNQNYNQANVLNTKSLSPANVDIKLPDPEPTETLIDDDNFFANERKNVVANMHDTLARISANPTSDDVKKLFEDQQKLLMTDPYEKNWQNQMNKLQEQLIQLEVIIQDKKEGLGRTISTITTILNDVST